MRIVYLVFTILVALSFPVLYQNCGSVKQRDLQSVNQIQNLTMVSIEIHNGAGTLISNGESLCGDDANETQSRSVAISMSTSLSVNAYHCRQVQPNVDNEFWNCENAGGFGGSSSGSFSWAADSDNTEAIIIYSNLENGTYELEISAEGGDGEESWATSATPVSFVVEDCEDVSIQPSTTLQPVSTTLVSTTTSLPPTTTSTTTTTTTQRPTTTTLPSTTTTITTVTLEPTTTTTQTATLDKCTQAGNVLKSNNCTNRPAITVHIGPRGGPYVEKQEIRPWYLYSILALCDITNWSDQQAKAYHVRGLLAEAGCNMESPTRDRPLWWKSKILMGSCGCRGRWDSVDKHNRIFLDDD